MAEPIFSSRKCNRNPDGSLSLRKRIDFHPAKRAFKGFSNGGRGFALETLNPEISDPPRSVDRGSGSSAPSTSQKRRNGSEKLDADFDPERSLGITLKRIGAGLQNLGNTCYLNSVLQCLTYTEPLVVYLRSEKHQSSCRAAGFCALCAIQKHVRDALKFTGRSLAPKDLVSNLRSISRNFRRARQEDAHEYMINLLESMHKCCLPAGVPSESPTAYEKSLVHNIFGGRLRSQVKCTQCSFCSNKFDPFLDLSLEIAKAESLHKALTHFAAKEYLDGGARQYQCKRCNQKVKALKQLTIDKAPNVLTVHLKRFGNYQPGRKIVKRIYFGPTLDLRPFVSGQHDEDLRYTLYGVLVHAGWSTRSGHYYSFVRTSSGMWYSLDDHQVRQVSEKMVLGQEAYMLFYVRDRKRYAPKKPLQNDIGNTMGNKLHSDKNQCLKKTLQISSAVKGGNILDPSAVGCQRDVAATLKDESVNKTSSPMIRNHSPLSQTNLSHGENLSQTTPIKGSAVFGINEGKINKCENEIITKEDLCDSIGLKPESKDRHKFADVPSTDKNSPKVCSEEASKIVDPLISLDRPSFDGIISESGSPPMESALGDSKTLVVTQLGKLSGTVTKPVSQKHEALQHKPRRLLKKKLIKCYSSIHLGPSMLFKSLLRRQKRTSKRIGKRTMKIKICAREDLFEGVHTTSDQTKSKIANSLTVKNVKCCILESAEGIVDGELRDTQCQNNAIVATSEKFETDGVQDGSLRMLTRTSEETWVSRWNGMEENSREITESSGAKTMTLGYVGDEWDEEYDQGKRKKIKKFIAVFDGTNPFQEIATKKRQKTKI